MPEAQLTAFLNDSNSRRVAREVDPSAKVHRGSVRQAAGHCSDNRSSDIMLVDLDGEQNPIAQIAAVLEVCRPESIILATGSENNVSLANELYRGGIFLYLPKPLDAANLRDALREVASVNQEQDRPKIQTSRVVLVHGKGMGANTVTVLLARLTAGLGRYIICLDLDANFGSLALAFDTTPERGLAQVLQDENGADALALDRLQARVSGRITLIAHPADQTGQDEFHHASLSNMVKTLSDQAHMILVCGPSVEHVKALAHVATDHLVVFEPTPAGISVAARWLTVLKGSHPRIIMNQARPLPNLVGRERLREAFGDKLPDLEIPYIRNMAEAMALGEPERAITRRERDRIDSFLQPLLGIGAMSNGA